MRRTCSSVPGAESAFGTMADCRSRKAATSQQFRGLNGADAFTTGNPRRRYRGSPDRRNVWKLPRRNTSSNPRGMARRFMSWPQNIQLQKCAS